MKRILIYGDEGVSESSKQATYKAFEKLFSGMYEIKIVTSDYVNKGDWLLETELFIMPGGYTRPHYKNLADGGNEKIRQFVEDGGHYLGICAGGYYGCAITEFDIGQLLEVKSQGVLNFFYGTATGPVYGPGTYDYGTEKGMRAATVSWPFVEDKSTKIYYNGGCKFSTLDDVNITVLSRFLDIEGTPPAILLCKVGKGLAILSGVHFEMSAGDINLMAYPNMEMVNFLEQAEPEKRNFSKNSDCSFPSEICSKYAFVYYAEEHQTSEEQHFQSPIKKATKVGDLPIQHYHYDENVL